MMQALVRNLAIENRKFLNKYSDSGSNCAILMVSSDAYSAERKDGQPPEGPQPWLLVFGPTKEAVVVETTCSSDKTIKRYRSVYERLNGIFPKRFPSPNSSSGLFDIYRNRVLSVSGEGDQRVMAVYTAPYYQQVVLNDLMDERFRWVPAHEAKFIRHPGVSKAISGSSKLPIHRKLKTGIDSVYEFTQNQAGAVLSLAIGGAMAYGDLSVDDLLAQTTSLLNTSAMVQKRRARRETKQLRRNVQLRKQRRTKLARAQAVEDAIRAQYASSRDSSSSRGSRDGSSRSSRDSSRSSRGSEAMDITRME